MSTGPYCHLSDKGLPLPSPALAQIYFQTTDATARKIDREENPDGRSTRLLWSRTEGMPHTDSRSHICGLVKRSSQLDEPLHLPDSFWAVLAGLIGPLLRICIMTCALYDLVIPFDGGRKLFHRVSGWCIDAAFETQLNRQTVLLYLHLPVTWLTYPLMLNASVQDPEQPST